MGLTLGAIILASVALAGVRFVYLDADPPTRDLPWDGGAYMGDEGMWYRNVVWQQARGEWHVEGGYNPIYVVPVMPATAMAIDHFANIHDTRTLVRAQTAVAVVLAMLVTCLAVGRRGGWWPAALTALLLTSSFTMYTYSRLALLDLPAVGFFTIGLSLLLCWRRSRPIWAVVLAAVFGAVAVLTKSTMLVAIPAYLVAAWMTPGPDGRRWRDPFVLLFVGGALLGAYGSAVLWFARPELDYFLQRNVAQTDNGLVPSIRELIRSGPAVGVWLFALLLVCLPVGLWRLRKHPGYPWIVSGLVTMLLLLAAVAWKGNVTPRYCVPLIFPGAVIVALVAGHAIATERGRLGALLVLGILLVVAGQNVIQISRVVRQPAYTYRDMASHVRTQVDALGGPANVVMIGDWTVDGIGLATGVPGLQPKLTPDALNDALDRYPVRLLVSWDNGEAYLPADCMAVLQTRFDRGNPAQYTAMTTHPFLQDRTIVITPLNPAENTTATPTANAD